MKIKKKIYEYISLFSGIGGFEYGVKEATSEWKCIGYSEIDKSAKAIYQYHYPEHKNYGDATKIITSKILDFDLLVAGFPCQSFSLAGKRLGFNDTRGTLFFEIARILKDKRPRYFILENVKGLLSADSGKVFSTILRILSELGYRVQWQVLNSKDYGVPQNRERVFIIGHLRNQSRPEVFPIETSITKNRKQGKMERHYSSTLCTREIDVPMIKTIGFYGNIPFGQFKKIYSKEHIAPTLPAMAELEGYVPAIIDKTNIRRLTPIECERLQGFPDDWTKYGIIDGKKVIISDAQRYKCLGNAITTNVITAIISKLRKETS